MHCVFLILIPCLIIQNALSREISLENDNHKNQLNPKSQLDLMYTDLVLFENDQRSMTDVSNQIKSSAKTAWNSLKALVQKTKEKIAAWVQQVKNQADAVLQSLEEKLTKVADKVKSLVANVLGNENVQKCMKENTEDFDENLREITNKVSLCISQKVSGISALEEYQVRVEATFRDTEFIEEIEKKLNDSTRLANNVEECLLNVRMDIIKDTDSIADDVLQKRVESRGITDDILDGILKCSTDGLIEATAVVSIEAINTIKCIVKHHGDPVSNAMLFNL